MHSTSNEGNLHYERYLKQNNLKVLKLTKAKIYAIQGNQLVAMQSAAPQSEDVMQDIVARYPEIIADDDGPLLLVRREQPIADSLTNSGRWSLDHLFVTRDGVPVLVELKRASDLRLRREVVGQMLDYAANATAYWKSGTISLSFQRTSEKLGLNPDEILAEFLGDQGEPDSFWKRVDDSFSAGRIKMVFVADSIPKELTRIVEFLNEQMKADVRAVELNWFEGDDVKAFSPRYIGNTSRAEAEKAYKSSLPPISVNEWIEGHLGPSGPDTVSGAFTLCEVANDNNVECVVTNAQSSIVLVLTTDNGASYPMSITSQRNGIATINLHYIKNRSKFKKESQRVDLYDSLQAIVGPLSTENMTGFPGFPLSKLNEKSTLEAFSHWFKKLVVKLVEG